VKEGKGIESLLQKFVN